MYIHSILERLFLSLNYVLTVLIVYFLMNSTKAVCRATVLKDTLNFTIYQFLSQRICYFMLISG